MTGDELDFVSAWNIFESSVVQSIFVCTIYAIDRLQFLFNFLLLNFSLHSDLLMSLLDRKPHKLNAEKFLK
jgi:hypothetical protein